MLTGRHRQHYEGLRQMVGQLQEIAARRLGVAEFQTAFLQVQQLGRDLDDGDQDLGANIQSYQTEINKQLRLLEIDLMFLKAARQAATSEQRWKMMGDRLNLFIFYCDTLLSKDFQGGDRT